MFYHPIDEQEYARLAARLRADGAVVLPVLAPAALEDAHDMFKFELKRFPEYRRDPLRPSFSPEAVAFDGTLLPSKPIMYVKGGFGALGNPGSVHNPLARMLRWDVHEQAMPLFRAYAAEHKSPDAKVHVIVDRMRIRRPDAVISAETWHRDTTPSEFTLPGDEIFGGWINLDLKRAQYFNCFLGSHNAPSSGGGTAASGFALLTPADQEALNKREHNRLEIPPGHMLVFTQDLIHEVARQSPVGGGGKHNIPDEDVYEEDDTTVRPEYRLFTAWRLTTGSTPLAPTLPADFFTAMAMPRLKSNQPIVMFPATGNTFGGRSAAINFSNWCVQTFPDALLKPWVRKDAKTGETDTLRIVVREMPSMQEVCHRLGVPNPYPAYTAEEQAIYLPHRECVARNGATRLSLDPDRDDMDVDARLCATCSTTQVRFETVAPVGAKTYFCSYQCQLKGAMTMDQ